MLKPTALMSMVALAAPVFAQSVPPSQAAAGTSTQAKAANPNDRIICEKQEEIGTRLGGKKVCKTAQEWQSEREQNRNTIEGVQRQATSTGIPGGSI